MVHLTLRIGLATVFLWFGVDAFLHPAYWATTWLPAGVTGLGGRLGLMPSQVVYVFGIFEVLVGVSMVSGVFLRAFSVFAIIFLVVLMAWAGFSVETIPDFGLIGCFCALLLWPERIATLL